MGKWVRMCSVEHMRFSFYSTLSHRSPFIIRTNRFNSNFGKNIVTNIKTFPKITCQAYVRKFLQHQVANDQTYTIDN